MGYQLRLLANTPKTAAIPNMGIAAVFKNLNDYYEALV